MAEVLTRKTGEQRRCSGQREGTAHAKTSRQEEGAQSTGVLERVPVRLGDGWGGSLSLIASGCAGQE